MPEGMEGGGARLRGTWKTGGTFPGNEPEHPISACNHGANCPDPSLRAISSLFLSLSLSLSLFFRISHHGVILKGFPGGGKSSLAAM